MSDQAEETPDSMASELLTAKEHEAMDLTAQLANIFGEITGEKSSREQDMNEMVFYVHGIQRMIMGQAAARAYPGLYRKLGDIVE